jgi:hypothetical protein
LTPDQAEAVLGLADPDGPIVEVRWFPTHPPVSPRDRPSVLLVTLDTACEHWGEDVWSPMLWRRLELALDDWDEGRLRPRWLLTAHQDPVEGVNASTAPSALVAAVVRVLRQTTPDHWRCRADRVVPGLLAVLAAADGWDPARVEAERVAGALASGYV